jgi:hypothetical protein
MLLLSPHPSSNHCQLIGSCQEKRATEGTTTTSYRCSTACIARTLDTSPCWRAAESTQDKHLTCALLHKHRHRPNPTQLTPPELQCHNKQQLTHHGRPQYAGSTQHLTQTVGCQCPRKHQGDNYYLQTSNSDGRRSFETSVCRIHHRPWPTICTAAATTAAAASSGDAQPLPPGPQQ